jgi:hypothetical protein
VANNRYYLLCPCGGTKYVGKSIGDGIYNVRGGPQSFQLRRHEGTAVIVPEAEPVESIADGQAAFLAEVYGWMWEHLMGCDHPDAEPADALGPEWIKGEIFKVITEYDDRAS